MATNQPEILDFGGTYVTSYNYTSNTPSVFIYGRMPSTAIDLLVGVGANPSADPSLVKLEPGSDYTYFTVPNPDYYPNGFEWDPATYQIKLKAQFATSNSADSTVTIVIVPATQFEGSYSAPTGIQMRRRANAIELQWSNETTSEAIGYNIYASTAAGGGNIGYLRINAQMIGAENTVSVEQLETDSKDVDYEYQQTTPPLRDLQVLINTVESANGTNSEALSKNQFPILTSTGYKVKISFSNFRSISRYAFFHNRDATEQAGILNSDQWSILANSEPIYYVVTALYRNMQGGGDTIVESPYSLEVAGAPLPIDVGVRGIQIRDASQVTSQYINTVLVSAPELSLIPGSTVREVHIEPFANEIQKSYFLMDFVHRSKSFPALLAIDDPNLTGISIPVENSTYKTNLKNALNVASDEAVQTLIDGSFDSLAQNYGISRSGSTLATVTQTFYLTSAPAQTLTIPPNVIVRSSNNPTAPRFIGKSVATITPTNALSFYNPATRRYEVKIQMIAETSGTSGNVPAGSLDTPINSPGWLTVNEVAAVGGTDIQSNLELAETAMRSLVGVDSGTMNGYANIVKSVPGVVDYNVVMSGDPDMMRDWDPVRQKHIGGKVDIWIKGTIERSVTETFAFSYDVANDIIFDVIDPVNLIFRARDSRLTVDNPIAEMLDNSAASLGLLNLSNLPSTYYNLTGVAYLDYRTIKLSTLVSQPATLVDDFITGDYRFLANNQMTMSLQPVRAVSSVVGELSGPLDPVAGFDLYKLQDPLLDGESTIATDYVEIHQVNGVPTGGAVTVSNETHVMIGQIYEPLGSVGINTFTLRVYSEDRLTEYAGPSSIDPDYLIIPGTQSTAIQLVRTTYSNIPSGSTISVDYEHDENFAVTYVVNDVLQQAQTLINEKKHITADVIVKQAVENPLLVQGTVQLIPNVDQSTVDNNIRTNYSTFIERKKVGSEVHVSDVVASIDNTYGVNYIVQPFARMTLQDGSVRVRDVVLSENVHLASISTGVAKVFILTQELPFATIDGGGPANIFHGVFKDNLIIPMAKNLLDVGVTAGTAWIIGRNGAVIDGYSDDATLAPEFVTPALIQEERLRRTANKVVVSLNVASDPTDNPKNYTWAASYVVDGDTGSKDVDASQVEYLTPGSLTLTFRRA